MLPSNPPLEAEETPIDEKTMLLQNLGLTFF